MVYYSKTRKILTQKDKLYGTSGRKPTSQTTAVMDGPGRGKPRSVNILGQQADTFSSAT